MRFAQIFWGSAVWQEGDITGAARRVQSSLLQHPLCVELSPRTSWVAAVLRNEP
jgi:hypothetical protein